MVANGEKKIVSPDFDERVKNRQSIRQGSMLALCSDVQTSASRACSHHHELASSFLEQKLHKPEVPCVCSCVQCRAPSRIAHQQCVPQGQTESGGIILASICWAPSAQRRCHPKEAFYLLTFSHILIVNKPLSLSLSDTHTHTQGAQSSLPSPSQRFPFSFSLSCFVAATIVNPKPKTNSKP